MPWPDIGSESWVAPRKRPDSARWERIFFDLDGTLLDSQEGILSSLQFCLSRMGQQVLDPKELLWAIGVPLDRVCARMLATEDPDLIAEAIGHYRENYWGGEVNKARLYPGVAELLKALSGAGLKLSLATHKLESKTASVLETFGILGHFSGIYGYNDEGPQEKALILARALKGEAADPERSVMIGDRDQDIRAAKACGTASIAVLYGYGPKEELEAEKPDYFCGRPQDLNGLLLS